MNRLKYVEKIEPKRSNLIKALQKVQQEEGYISDESVGQIADYFSLPPVDVEGVVTFYSQFKGNKPGEYQISVCDGTACHIKGSKQIENWITEETGIEEGETDSEGIFSLETVSCLGCCSLAPVIAVNDKVHGNLTREKLQNIIQDYRQEAQND